MVERYAVVLAGKIKKWNPEDTASQDVLVFGFTIVLNLFITMLLLIAAGFVVGKPFTILVLGISFMIMRILTGGPHLTHAIACSLCSTLLMVFGTLLPTNNFLLIIYTVAAFYLFARYAPYYEKDQVIHSKSWEQKKKNLALSFLFIFSLLAIIFHFHFFLIGALLQGITIIPLSIKGIHRLNDVLKGGGKFEENDC
ncbi:accessory gene regulator B family protein [Niallia sp. 03133]|uniref:accessory gene regulator B family protein n=1 Tax=Niallia sp. 03133 TaxID=3458060 RepID=UPI0040450163